MYICKKFDYTMKFTTCVILWASFFCVNDGATTGQKYKLIEKRLNTIEARLNYLSEDVYQLQESVMQLNQSYTGTDKCPRNDLNREQSVDAVKEKHGIIENDNDILLEAFKEGKAWAHAKIKAQESMINELRLLFNDSQSDFQFSNDNISERVRTLESHVELVFTNQIHMIINATVTDILDRLISDENQMKIYEAKMEEELQTLERTVNGIKNQSTEYSVTLNNFESKISDEIQKLKHDLAAQPSCPPDWSQFLGYCYHLYTTFADIDTAVKTCSNSSAFVVDIESEVELQFVKSLTDEWIWVGITDRKEEGNWTLLRNGQQMKLS